MSIDLHEHPLPDLHKPPEPFIPPDQPDPRLHEGYSAAEVTDYGTPAGYELKDNIQDPEPPTAEAAKSKAEEQTKHTQHEADPTKADTDPTDDHTETSRPAVVASGELAAHTVVEQQQPAEVEPASDESKDKSTEAIPQSDIERTTIQKHPENEHLQPKLDGDTGDSGDEEDVRSAGGDSQVLEGRHKEPADQNGQELVPEEKIAQERDTEETADQEPADAGENPPSPPDKGNGGGPEGPEDDIPEEPEEESSNNKAADTRSPAQRGLIQTGPYSYRLKDPGPQRVRNLPPPGGKHHDRAGQFWEGRKGAVAASTAVLAVLGFAAYRGATTSGNTLNEIRTRPSVISTGQPEGFTSAHRIQEDKIRLANKAIAGFNNAIDIEGGTLEHSSQHGTAHTLHLPVGGEATTITVSLKSETASTRISDDFRRLPLPATAETLNVEEVSPRGATQAEFMGNGNHETVDYTTTVRGVGSKSVEISSNQNGVTQQGIIIAGGHSEKITTTNPDKIAAELKAAVKFTYTALARAKQVALQDELVPPILGIPGRRQP